MLIFLPTDQAEEYGRTTLRFNGFNWPNGSAVKFTGTGGTVYVHIPQKLRSVSK
ncbi:hypothetical protein B0H19DRAFT_1150427 [Mycena capillaripes]|nr:hypothetical protein B0H19DRAFT_1150427 [Mycena capillaripes]